MLEMLFFCRHC